MVPSSLVRATIPNRKGVSPRSGPGGYAPCWSPDFSSLQQVGATKLGFTVTKLKVYTILFPWSQLITSLCPLHLE